MMNKSYYVYILASKKNGVLYRGEICQKIGTYNSRKYQDSRFRGNDKYTCFLCLMSYIMSLKKHHICIGHNVSYKGQVEDSIKDMQENKDQNHIPIDQSFWRTIGLISGDEHLFYVFKKTERIVTALYLVTNLIKDNDPLKWEIRERCMSLISSTIALAGIDSQEKNSYMRFFLSALLETRTFVNISFGSYIISKMNAEMIIGEIDALVIHIKDSSLESATRAGYVLSKSFFSTEQPSKTDDKGQEKSNVKKTVEYNPENEASDMSFKKSIQNSPFPKDSRKNSIIELLRKQPNLTIKDIMKVIPDCSTKTVQRELSDLVHSGMVKREGDRRWSRYSLK